MRWEYVSREPPFMRLSEPVAVYDLTGVAGPGVERALGTGWTRP
jgi:hypothetical protein